MRVKYEEREKFGVERAVFIAIIAILATIIVRLL